VEECIFMVWSKDELGDQPLFATNALERASAAYRKMIERYDDVLANDGLVEAMKLAEIA